MKFSAVVTRYFSFIGLSQNNPKWEGSEEVSELLPSIRCADTGSSSLLQALQYDVHETTHSSPAQEGCAT